MELFLFAETLEVAEAGSAAGVSGLVVDWEVQGKDRRQRGFDTQITTHSRRHLGDVRRLTTLPLICRVNGPATGEMMEDVAHAFDDGADEVLVPMVRHPCEVDQLFEFLACRWPSRRAALMIETLGALEQAQALLELPVSRVYVGLNDLWIERGTGTLFTPLVDGTVRSIVVGSPVPVGVAGLTIPTKGAPIPSPLLATALVSLECRFTFLRRSFLRDVAPGDFACAVAAIRGCLSARLAMTKEEIALDLADLATEVTAMRGLAGVPM